MREPGAPLAEDDEDEADIGEFAGEAVNIWMSYFFTIFAPAGDLMLIFPFDFPIDAPFPPAPYILFAI